MSTAGRPLLRRAAAVVFDTEEERRLASYAPRRPEWIMPAGIDDARFDPLPPREAFRAAFPEVDGPYLLFVGRVSRQKGLDLLIPAFARIAANHPELRLVIAGPDWEGQGPPLRTLARELGLERRVIFAGMVPHELKLAAYAGAELFVLPSYAENFGAVVTEALLCGLPVVISDQVNIHVELASAGLATVVQCTVDSVATGIGSALREGAAGRSRIAIEGPAFVRSRYTWEAIVPGLVRQYQDVIDHVAPATARIPATAKAGRVP
jgi:glycosyltransferase involved in cell wall biosynthesis